MYNFPKKEHLCGNKNIENLYTNGKPLLVYPLRIVYMQIETEEIPVRVMVSVSKKKFKSAVKRNRIKRLMRETYRLNKNELIAYAEQNDIKLHIALQYIATEIETFQKLNEKMQTALKKIEQNLQKNENAEENN